MLRISNDCIYGLEQSIIASGYPMLVTEPNNLEMSVERVLEGKTLTETKAFKRAAKLGNTDSNSGHGNYLSGIIVQFDVTYPAYWSMQFQRYHFVQIISSQSKMHKLAKLNVSESCNKYVKKEVIRLLALLQKQYNENPTYENYMELISNCPMGLEVVMRITTNYLQLKNIYLQRKTHKLKEDWGAFCDWTLTLPYFKELTGIE